MRLQITATVTAEPNGSGKDLSNFQEIVHDEDISTGIWKEFTVRGSGHSRGTRKPHNDLLFANCCELTVPLVPKKII